jgi:hypothetical protein
MFLTIISSNHMLNIISSVIILLDFLSVNKKLKQNSHKNITDKSLFSLYNYKY